MNVYEIWSIHLGPFLDLESALSLKGFFTHFGCFAFIFQYEVINLCNDFRWLFLFTQSLVNLEIDEIFFLINLNLRLEAPLLNSRLRKNYLNNSFKFKCYIIGFFTEFLGYPVKSLGISINSLLQFFYGTSLFFKWIIGNNYSINLFFFNYEKISLIKKINIFFGITILIQYKKFLFNFFLYSLQYFFNIFFHNLLDYLGRITMLELSFGNKIINYVNNFNFVYSCCERVRSEQKALFSIYQGSFLMNVEFNLYLPAAFAIERQGMFINFEGKFRFINAFIKPQAMVYADWEIFQMCFWIKFRLFDTEFFINQNFWSIFYKFIKYNCSFFITFIELINRKNYIVSKNIIFSINFYFVKLFYCGVLLQNGIISRLLTNYYLIQNIIPTSRILAMCSQKAWIKW